MESSGIVAEKFCIRIRSEDTSCNELCFPRSFYLKYGHLLLDTVDLRLRNGYVLTVTLDNTSGVMKGFLIFFMNFELKGGELLLFEYFGRYNLNVYILSSNGCEIRYPDVVNYSQSSFSRIVTLGDGGWRFVKFHDGFDSCPDEVTPPDEFLHRCEFSLKENISYLISNGKKVSGSYSRGDRKFRGLRSLLDIVGIPDLDSFHMILYEYHLPSLLKISVFDKDLSEIVFPGTPLSVGSNSHYPLIGSYFTITVEEKHMLEDCYVVEISNEFRYLVKKWDKIHTIYVYSETGRWMLYTRQRDDFCCRTIEDGWQLFRDGMKLSVGDICVFECPLNSCDHFSVRVRREDFDF